MTLYRFVPKGTKGSVSIDKVYPYKRCYNDAKDSIDGLVSPCLKPKGHSGKCQHIGLCKIVHCVCHVEDDNQ